VQVPGLLPMVMTCWVGVTAAYPKKDPVIATDVAVAARMATMMRAPYAFM
jgi:hypothetical protein